MCGMSETDPESAHTLTELLSLLRLERIEQNLFRGQSQDLGWGAIFGGQVLGQAGAQEIEGGAGSDGLRGGAGADSFVFAGSFGNDTIHDYLDGTDKLDFTAFNVDTRAELQTIATITAAGTSTLISLNAGGSVTIRNLAPAAIGDSDFILV